MKHRIGILVGVLAMIMSLVLVVFGFSQFNSALSSGLGNTDKEEPRKTYEVTLITGDQVIVEESSDGRYAVNINPAEREGYEPNFQTKELDEKHLYVIPEDVMPFLSNKLDRELFNITSLIEQGYDDEQSEEIPLIITFENKASLQDMSRFSGVFSESNTLSSINGVASAVSKDNPQQLLDALFTQKNNTLQGTDILQNNIKEIRLDRRVKIDLEESVPQVGAPEAWDLGYDGTGMTVAVLDTGIDQNHPDLKNKVVKEANFSDDDSVTDLQGHGTHVASTIAGSGEASDGLRKGVAPGASLINGKVLDEYGYGSESDIIKGMEWAAEQDASIINMSLGSIPTDGTDPMSQAVDTLTEKHNVLFVIAAGNDGPTDESVSAPGAADSALTVGAVDKSGELSTTSSRGPRIEDYAITPHITGPGVDIQAARATDTSMGNPIDDYYTSASGTSMAAPHVAGVAALYAQKWADEEKGDLQADMLKSALVSTAVPYENNTVYEQGGGLVDAERVLTQGVFSTTGILNIDFFEYPQDDLVPVTKTLSYLNTSDEEVALDLLVDVSNSEGGTLPDSMIELSKSEVVIEAGGMADVEVTVNPKKGDFGLYGGYVKAESTDGDIIHTPLGFYKEPESYDLTIEGITRDGQIPLSPSEVSIMNVRDINILMDDDLFMEKDSGELTFRVPVGTYNINSVLYTYDPEDTYRTTELAMINEPMVDVTEDTKVTLDAGTTFPITVEVENEVALLESKITYHRAASEYGSITSGNLILGDEGIDFFAYTPTNADLYGEFGFYTSWEYQSPEGASDPSYYKLVLEDEITSNAHYDIKNEALTQFNTGYFAHQPGDMVTKTQHIWRPYETYSAGVGKRLNLPTQRTEYFIADDTVYKNQIRGGIELRDKSTTYEQGVFEKTWFKQVITPGLEMRTEPISRKDNSLDVSFRSYTDADNHFSLFDQIANPVLRVFENEELIGETTQPNVIAELSSYESNVRLELETNPDSAWSPYSTNTLTNWTFTSAEPESGEQDIVPLMLIDYDLNLDLYNAAERSGVNKNGNDIHFEVTHQPGAKKETIDGANVWVSYDDGDNWQEIQDVDQLSGGEFRASLNHDDNPKGSGFVSLKVQAWDAKENSIEQEIIRAYRLPVTAENMVTHVERYEEKGAFENAADARLLKTHLKSVSRFEKQENTSKVIRHMESFYQLLDYQLDNELITEEAYNFLEADTGSILDYWKE